MCSRPLLWPLDHPYDPQQMAHSEQPSNLLFSSSFAADWSLLHCAAYHGRAAAVQLLLQLAPEARWRHTAAAGCPST